MKKSWGILLNVLFLCALVTFSFALQKAGSAAPQHKTFVGTIDSVTLADPIKGTKSEIVVVDKQNLKMTFLVLSTTTIHDAKGNAITLDKCQIGQEVNIKYKTNPQGAHEAISIKILK